VCFSNVKFISEALTPFTPYTIRDLLSLLCSTSCPINCVSPIKPMINEDIDTAKITFLAPASLSITLYVIMKINKYDIRTNSPSYLLQNPKNEMFLSTERSVDSKTKIK